MIIRECIEQKKIDKRQYADGLTKCKKSKLLVKLLKTNKMPLAHVRLRNTKESDQKTIKYVM